MNTTPPLSTIIAYARLGAVDFAWRLLCSAGLDRISNDPAALSVLGRLLKVRALGTIGRERKYLYYEAAMAYARASEMEEETYPLINAATLCFLADKREQAQLMARQVLMLLDDKNSKRETPYYKAATRAEAQLLLGDIAQAKASFSEAVGLDPFGYDDHASTLRQFALILDALDTDKSWLDAYRPPQCLHYAGHMETAAAHRGLDNEIAAVIKRENIGFGYGALAAGADILIAEALLKANSQLHLHLPTPPDEFCELSVTPFGNDWKTRFTDIVSAATSINIVRDGQPRVFSCSLQLAAEVAMGHAVLRARELTTDAVQLLILDHPSAKVGDAGGSDWMRDIWNKAGRRQHIITAPRVAAGDHPTHIQGIADPQACLKAILQIEWSKSDSNLSTQDIISQLADILARGPKPSVAPRWMGEALQVAYDTPVLAARAALLAVDALVGLADLSISGHYGLVVRASDPFCDSDILYGTAANMASRIVQSTPPGTVHLTENFAASLFAGSCPDRLRVEYIGELPVAAAEKQAVRLFALFG